MKPSFFKRVKRAVRLEFRRIRDEHRSTGKRHKKPPLSIRIRHHLKELKPDNHESRRAGDELHHSRRRRKKPPVSIRFRRWLSQVKSWGSDLGRKKSSKPHMPPLSKRIKILFSSDNGNNMQLFFRGISGYHPELHLLYLPSFFLIHFLTQPGDRDYCLVLRYKHNAELLLWSISISGTGTGRREMVIPGFFLFRRSSHSSSPVLTSFAPLQGLSGSPDFCGDFVS